MYQKIADSLETESYLFDGEEIKATHTEPHRDFVVTDSRVIDIRNEESDDEVSQIRFSSTLFNEISGVNITQREAHTAEKWNRKSDGFVGIVAGLALVLFAIIFDFVAGGLFVLIGCLVAVGGYWVIRNMDGTEFESSGMTIIELHHSHAKANDNAPDTYHIPAEKSEIPCAIMRAVGRFQGA